MAEGTWVGLDVHARKVVVGVLDAGSGELRSWRAPMHGLVYDASAWTGAHDAWLRRQRFASRPLALAFDESYAAVVQAKTRRDALRSPRRWAGSAACAAWRR